MPHVASLVFNSIGFVSNLYALKQINSTAFENPFALGFGGQYQVTQNNRELEYKRAHEKNTTSI